MSERPWQIGDRCFIVDRGELYDVDEMTVIAIADDGTCTLIGDCQGMREKLSALFRTPAGAYRKVAEYYRDEAADWDAKANEPSATRESEPDSMAILLGRLVAMWSNAQEAQARAELINRTAELIADKHFARCGWLLRLASTFPLPFELAYSLLMGTSWARAGMLSSWNRLARVLCDRAEKELSAHDAAQLEEIIRGLK